MIHPETGIVRATLPDVELFASEPSEPGPIVAAVAAMLEALEARGGLTAEAAPHIAIVQLLAAAIDRDSRRGTSAAALAQSTRHLETVLDKLWSRSEPETPDLDPFAAIAASLQTSASNPS